MLWNNYFLALLLSASLALASDQPQMALVHKKKYVMGTVFEIVAYGQSSTQVSEAIDQAFQEIIRIDDVMSDYKADSALSRLNHSSHTQAQTVPPDLYRIISEALKYSRLSGGKFDVTVGPLVNLWKAAIRGEKSPSSAEEERVRACVGYQKVELVPPDRILLHSPCLQIDLGGIGKGYALDRAADALRASGVSRALLDSGGSTIVAMGAPPGQSGWLVHLRDPSDHVDPVITLNDSSVSTSEQTPPSLLDPSAAGHIIDPDNGTPVKTPFAVSAVATTGTASDALSTTLLLLGPEKGRSLIEGVPGGAAIWIAADGNAHVESNGPHVILGRGAILGRGTSLSNNHIQAGTAGSR
jgi:thiamine biosynthesis lipoprotein